MSSLEDNVVADLKKEFGKSAGAEKAGEKKEDSTSKKKTIMQVFRPQNAKNSGRGSSNRPAGARQGAGRGEYVRPQPETAHARQQHPQETAPVRLVRPQEIQPVRQARRHRQHVRGASAGKSRADKQQSGSRREPWTERSTLTGEQKSGKPSAGQRKSAPWG